MSVQIPAVLVVQEDGTIASQNRASLNLLGRKTGQLCWDAVGGLKGAEGLPCQEGCTRKLLAFGMDRATHAPFRLAGQRHQLSCVPVDGAVVCALTRSANEQPRDWQNLTPREQSVLQLLAAGETTGSSASVLGLSEATVRTHVEKMRTKLGVNTRAALVAKGFQLGYLA
jgi:DNA-binding CsgD family transcriptional regulator